MNLPILLLISSLLLSSSSAADLNSLPHRYTSMFSFGDSLADTGNALITHAGSPVSRPPYGMTYFHSPTGRFSDGRVVVDFFAEAFGIPMLPPSLARGQDDFRQGANFAVGGATALDLSFFEERGMAGGFWTPGCLSVQIGWFEDLKPSLCNSPQDCSDYFSNSLAVIGEIGGNDYNIPFTLNRSLEEVTTYVPKVIESITIASERLIRAGVVNLLVTGNLPAGCHPIYLTLFQSPNAEDYDPYGCLERHNKFARYHNVLLLNSLGHLQQKYPQTKIMYADYYNSMIRFARYPDQFGFTNGVQSTCCGGEVYCGMPGCKLCDDPSRFVIWDGVHLTDAASHAIATSLLDGPFAVSVVSATNGTGSVISVFSVPWSDAVILGS